MKCSWALEKKCLWAYRKNEMFVGVKYKSDLIPVLETKKNEDQIGLRKKAIFVKISFCMQILKVKHLSFPFIPTD